MGLKRKFSRWTLVLIVKKSLVKLQAKMKTKQKALQKVDGKFSRAWSACFFGFYQSYFCCIGLWMIQTLI